MSLYADGLKGRFCSLIANSIMIAIAVMLLPPERFFISIWSVQIYLS